MSDDMFESIARVRATDSVVSEIQGLILTKKMRPGDVLPSERELAGKLSVSRNVLREALGVLAQKGLVESRPGRGTVVARPSADGVRASLNLLLELEHVSVEELCDARMIIEPELAARAATRASAAGTASLAEALNRLHESREDAAAHVRADLRFHEEIATLAGHKVFSFLVGAVREPVTRSMIFGTQVPSAIDHSDEQHRAIFEAIIRGDSDAARAAMEQHIEYVAEYVRSHGPVNDHEHRVMERGTE